MREFCLLYGIEGTGKYKKKNPTIQKAGPKELRHMLYIASVACIKHNSQLKKYYYDKVSAGMPAKKAIIKVAVKLARMMYSMLKHRQEYDSCRVFVQPLSLNNAAIFDLQPQPPVAGRISDLITFLSLSTVITV